jgi:hypothetical protein
MQEGFTAAESAMLGKESVHGQHQGSFAQFFSHMEIFGGGAKGTHGNCHLPQVLQEGGKTLFGGQQTAFLCARAYGSQILHGLAARGLQAHANLPFA